MMQTIEDDKVRAVMDEFLSRYASTRKAPHCYLESLRDLAMFWGLDNVRDVVGRALNLDAAQVEETVKQWSAWLASDARIAPGRGPAPLGPGSVRVRVSSLRTLLGVAFAMQALPWNPRLVRGSRSATRATTVSLYARPHRERRRKGATGSAP